MFINKDEIWTSNQKFKIATGLEIKEAELLLEDFADLLYKRRHPKSNAGRPSKLELKDIFLMLLVFIRQYVTLEFLGLVFDLNASNVKRWIDDSYEVLGEILVKKNFAHLIVLDHERIHNSALNDSEKFILMELNKISEGQKTA